MIDMKKDIAKAIDDMNATLARKHGAAYALGYSESFLSHIIMAYVPAKDHHRVLELITDRVNDLDKEEAA